MFTPEMGKDLLSTLLYFVISMLLFLVAVRLAEKLTPFSIRKEIEEDHNSAVAILMGAGLISLAIVLAAVIRS